MADKKHPGFTTKAEHQKTVFFSRMCIIIKLHRKFVIENRLGFLERNAMFFSLLAAFVESHSNFIMVTLYVQRLACQALPNAPAEAC